MKTNTLYVGDCLDRMAEWPPACVDLIYLDPPFNSKANYNILFGRETAKHAKNDLAQMVAFEDTWQWDADAEARVKNISKAINHPAHYAIKSLDALFRNSGNGMLAYLSYMAERLAEMQRILKPTGSIYLHCDPTASHYLKIVMDEIFGRDNFRNEITWKRYRGKRAGAKRKFAAVTDILLFYSNGKDAYFSPVFDPLDEDYVRRAYRFNDKDGKGPYRYGGRIRDRKYYLQNSRGIPITNFWDDVHELNGIAKESIGYPTQKPLALLERILNASSNEGDIVLDPFCGCGTTIHAAYNLKRKWVGIDISYYAIEVIRRDRMKDIINIELDGVPTDFNSADYFSDKDPFEFEKWAVSRIHGFAPNTVQRNDGGIDGRALIWGAEDGKDLCIAQVKRGTPSTDALRAFYGKIATGEAAIGLFITLRKQNLTPTIRKLIAQSGYLEIRGKKFNRLTMWSIEEFFADIEPKLPYLAHPRTGQPLHEDVLDRQDMIPAG